MLYDDRVEIENPGILLPGMTVEDVRQGVSKIRNRVIARVFRELDLIEQWGSGFRRILDEAEEQNLPEPVIEEIGMRVRFTIYLAESFVPTKESGPGRDQVGTKLGLSQDQVEILNICSNECGIKDLMARIGRSNRTKFRDQVLNPLISNKYIEMTIPDKPSSSKQKYRLTKRGEAALNTEPEI